MEYAFNPDLAVNTAARQDIAAKRREMEALSKSADPETRRAKLQEACEGFEAIFLQKMWEQMRATLPKDGLMKSKEEEFWQSMYDQELGKSMAASGGIGLADMMMRQLDRTDGAMSEATRQSTVRRAGLDVPPAPLLPTSSPTESLPAATADAALPPLNAASPVMQQAAPDMGIYEGEAPQAGEALAADALPGVTPDALNAAETGLGVTPPSVRQTLDELAAHIASQAAAPAAVQPTAVSASSPATRAAGVRPVSAAPTSDPRRTLQEMKGEAPYHAPRPAARPTTAAAAPAPEAATPVEPVITRITYQTNLPPSQRKASPFANRTHSPAPASYTAVPLSTASTPHRAGGLPAPAAPTATAQAPSGVSRPSSPSPAAAAAAPGVPAPEQDILAGIRPRFIPSRLTRAAETAPVTASAPAAPLPTQAGGPVLPGPEAIVEPVALGNPAPPRGSLSAPVSGDISSGFGWRLDPFTGQRAWHAGVDIKAAPGESVRAARSGVVTFAGEHVELGNLVVVDHGDGLRTFYGHNQELDVRPGQRVDAGTELARAGASGRAAGTHVHFEVRRGELALNPEPLLRQRDLQVAEAR